MNDRQARRHALSEWLMEFSVLWGVFPVLDQMIEEVSIHSELSFLGVGISFASLIGGILLRKGEPR